MDCQKLIKYAALKTSFCTFFVTDGFTMREAVSVINTPMGNVWKILNKQLHFYFVVY
jgi:hypothetical protein